jgi:hypothetical protein
MEKVDKTTFRWYYKDNDTSDIYLPVIWRSYQLNLFDSTCLDYIVKDEWNPKDALIFSLNFYTVYEYSLSHLSKIFKICRYFDIQPDEIGIFSKYNIKGKVAFENLEEFLKIDEIFQKYFDEKKLPLKYVKQIRNLDKNHTDILKQYIIQKTPSIGDFRNFLNFLTDYGYLINEDTFSDNLIEEIVRKNDNEYFDFIDKFSLLTSGFKKIKIRSVTNFETNDLEISFRIHNISDLNEALKECADFDKFNSIFKLMEDYDIS